MLKCKVILCSQVTEQILSRCMYPYSFITLLIIITISTFGKIFLSQTALKSFVKNIDITRFTKMFFIIYL